MRKFHIASCLENYAKSGALRLHMPGHKGQNINGLKLYAHDITELSFSDNLANACSVIKNAQEDISKLCGAKRSFILTGGSTLGVLAMAYALSKLGNKVIIQRSAHKSVFNCLKLFNITPVFFDAENNGYEVFESADNSVIGALLTSPDYFGKSLNLEKISNILKQKGKKLFIDGAHGGHFTRFNGNLYSGKYADVWVDGAHKTMHTLTQGAVLHLNDLSVENYIVEALDIFSTSSPSYPIMASVEIGVKKTFLYTDKQIKRYNENLQIVISAIQKRGFKAEIFDDPFKLTVNTLGKESALKLGKKLEKKGVFCELYGGDLILFMFSPEFDKLSAKRLATEILNLPFCKREKYLLKTVNPIKKLEYLQAVNNDSEWVDLKQATGRICALNVGLFPPCSPLIIAGETFDNEVIALLLANNTFGVKNGKVKVIKE